LDFNVPFQHKYGYIRDERGPGLDANTLHIKSYYSDQNHPHASPFFMQHLTPASFMTSSTPVKSNNNIIKINKKK